MGLRSTFGGLNTMVRGLNTNKISLDTVGHNISNANTPGYSRQNVNQAAMAASSIYTSFGKSYLGNGNDVLSITRARDVYADKQFWKDTGETAYFTERAKNYDKIEAVFDDSADTGIANAMEKFYQTWSDLSTTASNTSSRTAVIEQGKVLADRLEIAAGQVQTQIKSEYDEMKINIDAVNSLTDQLVSLNQSIMSLETSGASANDLRDERDLLVDELSSYLSINVYEEAGTGMYTIVSNGASIVNGVSKLTLDLDGPIHNNTYGISDFSLKIKETDTAFVPLSGTLQGEIDSIAENKKYIDTIANMAAFLMTTFNDLHRSGYGIDDPDYAKSTTEVNFYGDQDTIYELGDILTNTTGYVVKATDGSGTKELSGVEIIDALIVNRKLTDTNGEKYVAARQAGGGTADGSNAVLLSALINQGDTTRAEGTCSIGQISLENYYNKSMTALGVDAEACDNQVTAQEDIVEQVKTWRESTSGVNWDEELSNMIMFQQGYMACSRCLTTMDEMLDKLINGTGTVGR